MPTASARGLGLKAEAPVTVAVKATEVMILK
ncbi:MAG TPA: hypothetical protein VFS39_09775 [Nitrospira sp.]|nr:hypothetical protein [Nitrospira sp.]